MKKEVNISNRAIGPVASVSYKGMARRRNNKATGGEEVSITDMLNENQRGTTIQVSLKNTSAEDKVFAIYPGRLSSVAEINRYAGISVDAIAREGVIKDAADQPIATCSSKTLNLAQSWIKDHPMRFCRVKLQTDNEEQFSKEFGVATFELGKTTGSRTIRPIEHISPDQLRNTLCEIEVSLQLDDATVFFAEVAAGRSLDLSLQVVTEMNSAMALSDIVKKLED